MFVVGSRLREHADRDTACIEEILATCGERMTDATVGGRGGRTRFGLASSLLHQHRRHVVSVQRTEAQPRASGGNSREQRIGTRGDQKKERRRRWFLKRLQ